MLSAIAFVVLTITPHFVIEPAVLHATIKMADASKVRQVCIVLEEDGDDSRRSCWPPSGNTERTQIANIPAGAYLVYAEVEMATTGAIDRTPKQLMTVIPRGGQ